MKTGTEKKAAKMAIDLSLANYYPVLMQNGPGCSVLDEMLEPVSRCFGLETARALAGFPIDEKVQSRVDELATRCNEGRLTSDERAEYEACVQASTLIGILQAKVRRALAHVKL